jgi:hypothetical protein
VVLRDTTRDVVIDTFPAEAVRRGLPMPTVSPASTAP